MRSFSRSLMLAALGALSIGVGAAMAQSEIPSDPGADYWSTHQPAGHAPAGRMNQVQSGASDLENGANRSSGNYGTLANPG